MAQVHERVWFTVLIMPCCGRVVCNLTRLPNYCPECGTMVMDRIKGSIQLSDYDAMLSWEESHD